MGGSIIPVAQRKRGFALNASLAINLLLIGAIGFVLFAGAPSQLGSAMIRAKTPVAMPARVAHVAPMRNVASYAQKTNGMEKFMRVWQHIFHHNMKFLPATSQDAKVAGALGVATSAALFQGAAQAAEELAPLIYQEGKNPPLVDFAWGMFGASFTMSIALVVFGRSGL